MITRKVAPGARRRLHDRAQARRADAVLGARAGRARRARRHPQGRAQRRHRQTRSPSAASCAPIPWCASSPSPARPRSAASSCARAPTRSRSSRSSWAATRPSSSSTTPTSTPPPTARIASKYRNAGQTCVCANRIYVQDAVYDAFAAKLAEKVRALKVGRGTEQGVTVGPAHRRAGPREGRGARRRRAWRKGAKVVARRQAPRARRALLRAHGPHRRHARR